VIAEMLSVTDSRFQGALLDKAKRAGKISSGYEIPDARKENTPGRIRGVISRWRDSEHLRVFPFGTDFNDTEQRLLPALAVMQRASTSKTALLRLVVAGWGASAEARYADCLERMGLKRPRTIKDHFYRAVLKGALARAEDGGED
jgi:hypothetical protein